jgi:hypothetical protein
VQALLDLMTVLLRSTLAFFRSRNQQAIVELALRQQLATYAQTRPKPKLTPLDRAFWVALFRLWPKPDTVVRWHHKGFRLYWRWISKRGPGRPRISEDVQALIRRFALENAWGARKIHAELEKLGLSVSLATVSRYLPRRPPDQEQRQRWMTFLRNHKDGIAAMDFFVVPTVGFRLLYVWFLIDHGRRRIIHFNVTTNPTAQWMTQQLRESFPDHPAFRYLIYDNDSIFSDEVKDVIVFNEEHLRRLLPEYVSYYNAERVHTRLRDAPEGRSMTARPCSDATIVGLPRVGGLHHRSVWREAA